MQHPGSIFIMAKLHFVASLLFSSFLFVASGQKFNALFSFGDSMSDTGNLCVNGAPAGLTLTQPPYGETYFGRATCRCSDGRLVVDFLAQSLGLPLLPPSKKSGSDFTRGANMAIIGATTMESNFFQSLGIADKIWNNGPLNTQIQWFQQLMPSICGSTQDCKSYLSKSLFVLGEIGGNDYNAQVFGGYTPEQASSRSATLIDAVGTGVEQLIGLGATYIVVPGVLPIGCFPIYLTIYQSSNQDDSDQYGCLKRFNALSTNHNSLLQNKISSLQSKYPSTRIMYADFYSHVYEMVKNPQNYGFSTSLQACCGAGGGKYNYNNNARCGMQGASACSNPSASLSWDGIHLTEAAYKQITAGWLNGPYCHPPILQ